MTEVASDPFAAIASFSRLVASRPHPDEIIRGIVEGPLAPYTAFAGILMWSRDPALHMIGMHGYTPEETEGFEEIPIAADLPITLAVRDAAVVIGPGETFEVDYTDTGVDDDRWQRMRDRVPIASFVGVPIIGQGKALGAYGVTFSEQQRWRPGDISLLEVLGHIVSLWMLHPDSRLPWPGNGNGNGTVQLSDRQVRILRLVAAGKTNDSIAVSLGYSSSTVKQELGRVLRALNAPTRQAAAERAAALGLLEEQP